MPSREIFSLPAASGNIYYVPDYIDIFSMHSTILSLTECFSRYFPVRQGKCSQGSRRLAPTLWIGPTPRACGRRPPTAVPGAAALGDNSGSPRRSDASRHLPAVADPTIEKIPAATGTRNAARAAIASLAYPRMKPSISSDAQAIAWSILSPCVVQRAIILVIVACEYSCVAIFVGAGAQAIEAVKSSRGG